VSHFRGALHLPVAPVTPKSAPVIFFRGISLEIPMESAFVDDIAGIFDPFLRFSPVFCPVYFFPPEISQWRRVRIRLHPQPASPVSASWFPGVGEPPAFPGFRLKASSLWRQYSRSPAVDRPFSGASLWCVRSARGARWRVGREQGVARCYLLKRVIIAALVPSRPSATSRK
jgi:hypothetical protein